MGEKVIICEGMKDVRFLCTIHREFGSTYAYLTFNNENVDISESKRIRQHLTDNRTDILYKAEGGKSKLIKIFADVGYDVCHNNCELYILLDLDNKPLSYNINLFNKELKRYYDNRVKITVDERKQNEHMILATCKMEIAGVADETVRLLSFYNDQEAVTGINKGEESDIQIRKIRSYMEEYPEIVQDIADTLY